MRLAALLALSLLLTACPPKCDRNAACDCGNGRMGFQFCNTENEPGACNCGPGGGAGGGTGGGGGGGGSITLQDFCANYPAAACATQIACGRYSDAGLDVCLARESSAELCRRAAAGSVQFDGVVAARCLMELQSGPLRCASDFPPCQLVGFGQGSIRSEVFTERLNGCGTSTCGAGTICDRRCTGPQCQPLAAVGQSCDTSDGITRDCVREAACSTRDGGAYTCLALTPRGGDCSDWSCLPDDYCDTTGATPTCRAKLAREAPCSPGDACFDGVCRSDGRCGTLDAGARCEAASDCGGTYGSDLVCLGLQVSADGGTVDAGVCGPRPGAGQPCSRSWARVWDPCRMQAGEACLDGVCTYLAPFSRPLGAECPLRPWGYTAVPFYGFAVCERGLGCRPDPTAHPPQTGRCQPAQPEGGECRDEFECAGGLGCYQGEDGGTRCARLPGVGESCAFAACQSDLQCQALGDGGARCVALAPLAGGCALQSCVPNAQCVNDVCEPLGGTGASCDYGFQCQSGVCQFHQCVSQCMR